MAIDWAAVKKKAKRQDAAYNAKATQGAENRAAYQAIAKNKAAAAQIKANPSMLTAKITPITTAQTAAEVAKGNIPNAFQNQKESGFERVADAIGAGTSSLVGGAANAVRLATTGKYSPTGIISRGIDKIRGTNYTEQNAANQQSFVDKMMDQSKLSTEYAKRGISKAGQIGVDIGSAATQIGLMALTGGATGALGAGSKATGALSKGLMAIQQAGQGAYDAEKAGAGEGTQALYGLLQGATAYATEGISNVGALGKVFGNGAVDSKLEQASANAISKFIKSKTGRAIANRLATGAEAGLGEALEQNIQDALTPVYQRLTYDKNAKLNAEDMIYNGLVAGAVGGIVGSAGKNNLKALETENDVKAAERLTAAKTAPPVTNTAPNLSQVAPNLIKPSQNIAQKAAQAPTVNESVKEVKLPAETENALKTRLEAPETKTNIFPENSLGAKITNDMPQGTGAKSLEFPYKERVNQQNSTQTAFTPKEQAIEGLRPEDSTHQVITDKNAVAKAQERIDFDYEGEKADLPNKQDWDKNDTTTAQLILRKLTAEAQKSGDYSDVIKWNKTLTQHTSAQGQALQANAQFANTPERIVADAAETLFGENTRKLSDEDKNNIMKSISDSADKLDNIKRGDTASVISLIKDLNKIRKTTGLFSKETSAQMSEFLDYASKLPDGEAFLRDVAAQQIRNIASDYQKTSVLNAIKNYRVMGMLSKLTTILRNLTANNIFDPIESLSTNAGVPLDILLSKYTKTRSTAVDKSWFSSAKRKGSIDGFVKSAIQVGLDVDVTNSSSKYETHSGRTFKMTGNPVERFLSTWAKWENYGLQSTDEFQKGGIAAETQRGIDQLKSKGLVAKDALAGRAEEVAKQRTFQNDGALATAMLKGRDALNVFSVKDKRGGSLGAGDVAVLFAKVPANIVAQGGNYSPAGFIKAIGNLGKTLAQAHEGTLTADQQAKAVMDFGRATTGSAGIAMFTALALKGIIKVAGSDDKDKEALQTSEGQSGTQFNISALNRWINGKSADWQDGDTLMSIGFLEPINAQMAMGAMIADAYKDDGKVGLADVANANVSSVFQSVLDLPAMSQISDLVNGYKYSSADTTSGKLGDAALGYGASQAASFLIPNIVGGVATGMDGTVRNTYTSKNPLKQATDSIVSKIPGLRNTLPAKQDSYGNDRQTTGNKLLDMLNANILPGQIGKYSTNEVNQELYRLDTKYPVRNAPNTIKSNKLTYALTLDEKAKYLKTMGQTEYSLMQAMISSSAYKSMTDEQKSDALNNLMLYARDKANREFVTSKGAKYTSEKYEKVYEAEQQGISPTDYFIYKTKLDEINDNDNVTQLESTMAIEKTSLSQNEKGKLWQIQNSTSNPEKNPYTGTLAQLGLSPSKTIEIMEAFSTIDDAVDKNYVKADKGPSAAQVKAAYLIQWLTRQGYNANQRAAITDVFTTWQMIPIDKPSKKATQFVNANPMP